MTYSHEQPKGWGFSRKPFNLNRFGQGHERFNVWFANRETTEQPFTSHLIGDVKWLKTNILISIQYLTNWTLRLQRCVMDTTANTISIIISFGYQNTEGKYLLER